MASRRRQHLIPDHNDGGQSSNMEQLAFKYMMCKVESSTDSDSEISPRWSDTSTMECVSSAPESGTLRRTLPEPPVRHGCYSLFLDPYDGSSEDSDDKDAPSRRTRQHRKGGGGRFSHKSRRFILHYSPDTGFRQVLKTQTEQQHLVDVQMKCTEDSEVWLCELLSMSSHTDLYGGEPVEEMSNGADINAQLNNPAPTSSQMPESSTDRSPGSTCNLRVLFKRKLAVPTADGMELGHRKRQCVVNMEEEEEKGTAGGGAAWE
uniref:uncharacterized protein LOC131140415 isoform X2 n=1 Tax=Doryrhamphus excisus TaxID=161450 RepID=UPI0025AE7E44|nr:uncharacterized protein LOC131140415 isoform X2 [Doryrhamphus excisus]